MFPCGFAPPQQLLSSTLIEKSRVSKGKSLKLLYFASPWSVRDKSVGLYVDEFVQNPLS